MIKITNKLHQVGVFREFYAKQTSEGCGVKR